VRYVGERRLVLMSSDLWWSMKIQLLAYCLAEMKLAPETQEVAIT
jgi:hypothetical protein